MTLSLEVHVVASDEYIMDPPCPLAVKILFAYVTSKKDALDPEFRKDQSDPLVEVKTAPISSQRSVHSY